MSPCFDQLFWALLSRHSVVRAHVQAIVRAQVRRSGRAQARMYACVPARPPRARTAGAACLPCSCVYMHVCAYIYIYIYVYIGVISYYTILYYTILCYTICIYIVSRGDADTRAHASARLPHPICFGLARPGRAALSAARPAWHFLRAFLGRSEQKQEM